MAEGKRLWQAAKTVACAGASALIASACISANDSGTAQVTPQGTVQLEAIKAGMLEDIFKNARVTFAVDTHQEARKGDKTQYISRFYSARGGQYMAECKDDRCYELEVLFRAHGAPKEATGVSKDDALATMKELLPTDAPDPVVDDSRLKDKRAFPNTELYYFGNKYLGVINYDDKSGKTVNTVTVFALPPQVALKYEFGGKVPKNLNVPDSAKGNAVAQAGTSPTSSEH
jgi:hypothetical protein